MRTPLFLHLYTPKEPDRMVESDINYVHGLSVWCDDGIIHVCRDVEHTMCGIVIPECEGVMVIRSTPGCSRCREMMTEATQ